MYFLSVHDKMKGNAGEKTAQNSGCLMRVRPQKCTKVRKVLQPLRQNFRTQDKELPTVIGKGNSKQGMSRGTVYP